MYKARYLPKRLDHLSLRGGGLVSLHQPVKWSCPLSPSGCRAGLSGSGNRTIRGQEVSTQLLSMAALPVCLSHTLCTHVSFENQIFFLLPTFLPFIFLLPSFMFYFLRFLLFFLQRQTHRGTTRNLKTATPFARCLGTTGTRREEHPRGPLV